MLTKAEQLFLVCSWINRIFPTLISSLEFNLVILEIESLNSEVKSSPTMYKYFRELLKNYRAFHVHLIELKD